MKHKGIVLANLEMQIWGCLSEIRREISGKGQHGVGIRMPYRCSILTWSLPAKIYTHELPRVTFDLAGGK